MYQPASSFSFQDAGYGEKSIFAPDDDDEDSQVKMDDEVIDLELPTSWCDFLGFLNCVCIHTFLNDSLYNCVTAAYQTSVTSLDMIPCQSIKMKYHEKTQFHFLYLKVYFNMLLSSTYLRCTYHVP